MFAGPRKKKEQSQQGGDAVFVCVVGMYIHFNFFVWQEKEGGREQCFSLGRRSVSWESQEAKAS